MTMLLPRTEEDAMTRNGNSSNIVWGFLAGAVVGTTIGMLYAPKKGKRLRADLSRKAEELVEDAQDMIHGASTKATDVVSDARKQVNSILENVSRSK
jgi:gas vesicle protein